MMSLGSRWLTGLAVPMLAGSLALAAPATPATPHGGNPHNDNPNAATPAQPGARDNQGHGRGQGGGTTETPAPAPAPAPAPVPPPAYGEPAPAQPGARDDRDDGRGGYGVPARPGTGYAQPAGDESENGDVRRLMPGETSDLLDQNPDVRREVRRRWQTFGGREKRDFLRTHPRWRMNTFRLRWEQLAPDQRGEFVACQPAFVVVLQDRWNAEPVDDVVMFGNRHPGVLDRMGERRHMRGRRHGRRHDRRGDAGGGYDRDQDAGQPVPQAAPAPAPAAAPAPRGGVTKGGKPMTLEQQRELERAAAADKAGKGGTVDKDKGAEDAGAADSGEQRPATK